MRYTALTTVLLLTSTLAWSHPLLNDREASSFIIGTRTARNLDRLNLDAETFKADFLETLKETTGEACSFTLVRNWTNKIERYPEFRGNKEQMLQATRHLGIVDDVVLRSLLQAHWVLKDVNTRLDDTLAPAPEELSVEMKRFKEFSDKRKRGKCLSENYKELMSAFRQTDKNFTVSKLKPLIVEASRANLITDLAKEELDEAIKDSIGTWEYTLAEYVQKKNFLRTQHPIPRSEERSEFVTKEAGNTKLSHRQKLFAQYSSIQISLMGNVIKKLKTRLESPRIDILIYDDQDTVVESFTLDPMERFRFAIRVLRKEMKILSTNNYFQGRQPQYTDLMAAAFEMGIVTAVELDQVAKLEEIWNPTRTFWDKASVWVRLFGSTLSIVVPPPFGFVPTLAIVAIEIFNRDQPQDDQHSLF